MTTNINRNPKTINCFGVFLLLAYIYALLFFRAKARYSVDLCTFKIAAASSAL